jgi:formylglycine-generating enzyme required for sulfatase activity
MIRSLVFVAGLVVSVSLSNAVLAQSVSDTPGGPSPAAAEARVYFIDLHDRDRVPRGTIVHFGLTKMGVAPAGMDKPNTGHHHILIDEAADNPPPASRIPNNEQHIHFGAGQTEWALDLKPGPHRLRLLLGDTNHVPHSHPVMSKVIRIVVTNATALTAVNVPAEYFRDCPGCAEMATIQPGEFDMGTPGVLTEMPVHHVTLTEPFAIGRNLVTFREWDLCVDDAICHKINDGSSSRGNLPVVNVTWNDTQDFTRWLTQKTGKNYRLPTEAEWEVSARAGTTTKYFWGKEIGADHAKCTGCNGDKSESRTVEVGSYPENQFGLFDMAGNAAEWVKDCWNQSYRGAPANGSAWMSGDCSSHVLRGGSYESKPEEVRTGSRWKYDTDVPYVTNGFRVARDMN